MRKLAILLVLGVAACGPLPATGNSTHQLEPTAPEVEQRIDVARLLGQDKATVASVLGEPGTCDQQRRGESCPYGDGSGAGSALEVFFIDDRAANLTLPGHGLPFEPQSLRAYGIDVGEPTEVASGATRWDSTINGREVEVSIFPAAPGEIDYVYVMTKN